jgi:hypothetical protein
MTWSMVNTKYCTFSPLNENEAHHPKSDLVNNTHLGSIYIKVLGLSIRYAKWLLPIKYTKFLLTEVIVKENRKNREMRRDVANC